MPITSSAKKANRQNSRRNTENRARKDAIRNTVKSYKKLLAEKKFDEAKAALPKVYKVLDKVAKSNVITKNKASRLKSRLSALLPKSK